jgi:BMFP domain-containing protein YqiC
MADMQKQAVENMTAATEKMQKAMMNPDLSSDFFKKWYDSQMSFFNQNAQQTNSGNPMEFFNTWMNNQMGLAKNWLDASGNMMKSFNMGNHNNEQLSNMMNLYNSWMNSMTSTYTEMYKNFQGNLTSKNAFSGMFNNAEMYMKVFELWMPMFKSMQDKTFTPELFKQMFNAPLFKDMMDKMFGMQPDFMKNFMGNDLMKENMNKMMDMNKGMYDQYKNMLNTATPDMTQYFGQMNNGFQQIMQMMQNAAAPLMKLMPANKQKQQLDAMNEMANLFQSFNMLNTKIQYHMYQTGLKASEEVAENIYNRMRNGEEMSSFINLYSEWLNTNDKHFVNLFSSEEYSKLQGELNSVGMKMKRHMDLQMEEAFANLPLVNRSEMDELYHTIHELKKRIHTLEKQIDAETEATETKPTRKAAKNA